MIERNDMREASRPGTPVGLMIAAVLCGAAIGAGSNAINGAISPAYFQATLRWEGVTDLWRAALAQGIFEGLVLGLVFGVIVTLAVAIFSRMRCPMGFAVRHLLGIVLAVCLCWGLGGLISLGLASLSGEWYRQAFRNVPDEFGAMLRFAWVGGSIWGVLWGGLVCVIVGSALFPARWRRRQRTIR